MNSDKKGVIYDVLLCKELGVLLQDAHYLLFILMAYFEHFFSIQEVEVFESDGAVHLDATLVFDRLSAISGTLQIEP